MFRKAKQGFDLGKSLFLKEEFSDVEILVGTDGSICRYPCHKVILSAGSEVFATMFKSKFKEGETGEVTIKDIKPDIMLILLTYMYSGCIDLENWKTAIEILKAAHKYQMGSLVKCCELYMLNNLTWRNVCFILDFAILYDLIRLKEECLTLCKKGGFVVLKTRAFRELSVCAVKHLISMKDLVLRSKIDLFSAVWEWGTMECCRKQKKLTEENIFAEFSEFCDYVGFEFMNHAELESLPKSVLKYINDKSLVNSSNGGTESEMRESSCAAKRDLLDFVDLFEFYLITVNFECRFSQKECFRGTHLSFLRFSLDSDVYLSDFTLMPLNNVEAGSYFEFFRISSKNKTAAMWSVDNEETLCFEDIGSHIAAAEDYPEIRQLRICARGFILLEADEEYTMEIKVESSDSCIISWPRVFLKTDYNGCKENVKIRVHSQYSFAISQMNFIQAS